MFKRKKKAAEPTAPIKRINYTIVNPRHEGYTRALTIGNPYSRLRLDRTSLGKHQSAQDVFIYTVSEQDIVIPPHPFLPKGMTVKGKFPDDLCALVLTLPIACYSVKDNANDELVPTLTDGVRVAVDIINPDNLSSDLDACSSMVSLGRDLAKKGLFYSLSNPPNLNDYEAARRRLKKYYQGLVERATATFWSGGYRYKDEIDSELPFAAKFLGLTNVPWARRKEDMKK